MNWIKSVGNSKTLFHCTLYIKRSPCMYVYVSVIGMMFHKVESRILNIIKVHHFSLLQLDRLALQCWRGKVERVQHKEQSTAWVTTVPPLVRAAAAFKGRPIHAGEVRSEAPLCVRGRETRPSRELTIAGPALLPSICRPRLQHSLWRLKLFWASSFYEWH